VTPKLEVSPLAPFFLFLSPFFWVEGEGGGAFIVRPAYSLSVLLLSLSLSMRRIVRAPAAAVWAARRSDTAWSHSLTIRQMGLVQVRTVGGGGASGACMRGATGGGSRSEAPLPHRACNGWGRDAAGRVGPPSLASFHSPLAPPPFSSSSELSLLGRGGLFCPETHTHEI